MPSQSLQQLVDNRDRGPGRVFAWFIQFVIIVSILDFTIETIPSISSELRSVLWIVEVISIAIFSLDFMLRIALSKKGFRYAFTFFGHIEMLAGTRPDRSKVPVECIGEGSRDELYLALRFAALDRYLNDLLITFDNNRTKAILPQLSELAKRTQVFLFTHHEHLIDLCQETLGEDRLRLHRLDSH